MEGTNITELESQVLDNIVKSEYMSVDKEDRRIIDWPVWSFSVTQSRKDLAGAIGSLVKKGLLTCQMEDGSETVCLTEAGFNFINR